MSEQNEQVYAMLCDILEDQSFLLPDEDGEGSTACPDSGLMVSMAATGTDKDWRLHMAFAQVVCDEIASNLLGADPDADDFEEICRDAVGEMVNVLAGRLIYEVCAQDGRYQFTSPEVTALTPEAWQQVVSADGAIVVSVEGAPVALSFGSAALA